MSQRRFAHSNTPAFRCRESVILLPFGRRSYLPAIVDALAGEEISLDETTDRIAYTLHTGSTELTEIAVGIVIFSVFPIISCVTNTSWSIFSIISFRAEST